MMIGYFDYVVPVDVSQSSTAEDRLQRRAQELFDRLDKNVDGKVVLDEVPAQYQGLFKPLGRDNDDVLTVEEVARVFSLGLFPGR